MRSRCSRRPPSRATPPRRPRDRATWQRRWTGTSPPTRADDCSPPGPPPSRRRPGAQGGIGGVVGWEEELDAHLVQGDVTWGPERRQGGEERELLVAGGVAEAERYDEIDVGLVSLDGGREAGDVRVGV